MHVEGKPRKEHDRMILGRRDGHEQPEGRLSLAVGKDELIEMPRYPESIKTGGKHKSLRHKKYNLLFAI